MPDFLRCPVVQAYTVNLPPAFEVVDRGRQRLRRTVLTHATLFKASTRVCVIRI